jgi:NAD+ kinase
MKVFVYTNRNCGIYDYVAARFELVDDVSESDVVVTIGGDGTILRAGVIATKAGKPLLGINTGRLGFMATLEKDELDKLERLKNREYSISRRMLIDVQGHELPVLNDVVLSRGKSRLPEFVVVRKNVEIIRVRADGIIVSTPTGSTAYSLSAGGPIVEPELECFLVTALSPHTLFNRPMLFTCDTPLSVFANDVFVSIDGQQSLSGDMPVVITKSEFYLDLIDIDGNNFYDSIHNKLMKPLK